ncbi:Acyl-protein thioesterase 1 [Tolypocladium ophioglossoides CBS 100239]|uniref:Acyl-protein thioesterase 1 n=1 Tax=Tolypocladium ophioglossoides (strain CBS 100239) TaxID=1163406 RepID=A0A0L0MZV3_TOLOC|nr:Acyl-protein thioesterase 1 [Tolypocladium ophioglossoides CBS 100239]
MPGPHPSSHGASDKPPPFTIQPTAPHTHSFLLLHGLGSNGEKFGRELLETGVCSNGKSLMDEFPGARFIFPTAKRRRSSAWRRAKLTQWFDIASLDDPSHRSDTQLEGLAESSREILGLINQESREVPRGNIILGGLSQGCAISLCCLLAMDCPIGGFIGMSGWLPFQKDIKNLTKDDEEEFDGENPFASSEQDTQDLVAKVVSFARDLLDLDEPGQATKVNSAIATPIFLGHGNVDDKIKPSLGEDACETLRAVGFDVLWRTYKDQGHWYKIPDEIDDLAAFIREKA